MGLNLLCGYYSLFAGLLQLLRDWKQLAGLEGNLYTLCNALKELGFKDAIGK